MAFFTLYWLFRASAAAGGECKTPQPFAKLFHLLQEKSCRPFLSCPFLSVWFSSHACFLLASDIK